MTSWDEALLGVVGQTSLVTIARERRLVLEDANGPRWVDLCWVDEVALTLIELSLERGCELDILYPAPAGQVAVLLAAQLLLHRFVHGALSPSVGIVTGDPTVASRTWDALHISAPGSREPISRVFQCFRAGPAGESPWGGQRPKGVIIGQRYGGWPVDHLVVDHLSGYVDDVWSGRACIELFSDPLDRGLRRAEEQGRLVWGWSDGDLSLWDAIERRRENTVDFSVASDRLETMSRGLSVRLVVCQHPEAEAALARVREDLRLLRTVSPGRSDRNLERGLSVAWHHLSTLISLPSSPSRFDRFAGLPPAAARATVTFGPEISAWARTLVGDAQEYASVLASDLADLRAALEDGNPFEPAIRELRDDGIETLAVTRTNTASKALLDSLGEDPAASHSGLLTVGSLGRLHRQGTWPRALMIGEPSPWDWHRLVAGLSPELVVLTLGERSASAGASAISEVVAAREHWGSPGCRGPTWRALVGTEPPPVPETRVVASTVAVLDGSEYVPEPDPFEPLASLFELDPLDLGAEGPRSGLAREDEEGEWTGETLAVEVTTDHGTVLLEIGRPVEVRVGDHIVDKRPEALGEGDTLLVGRQQGRVILIEFLEERLGNRPDLLAARLLIDDYRMRLRNRFRESGLGVLALHRELRSLGCDKTSATVRNWVMEWTIAPQDFVDLERLNLALDLGLAEEHLAKLYAGVQRRRGFRRAAGRALAAAARDATVVGDETQVDHETGLSVVDLRDAVVQAKVLAVKVCDAPVPLTLLGRLEGP